MDLKDGKADDKGKGKKKAAKKEVVKDATWEEDKKKAEEAVKLKESQLNLYQKSLQVAKDILTAFEREVREMSPCCLIVVVSLSYRPPPP